MTETEAQNFVNDVLKGLWTDWEITDAQYSLWARRLLRFHYGKAKNTLENWFCEAKRTYKSPPINNILKYLISEKAWDKGTLQREPALPVLAFELFDQENPRRRMKFYESSLAALKRREPHEIEKEAEQTRLGCNELYKCNFVLLMEWKRHFEESLL